MYEMKKVFICSPYRGDIEKNVEKARYYSRMAAVCGYCPITPHLFFPQFLKDGVHGRAGIRLCGARRGADEDVR